MAATISDDNRQHFLSTSPDGATISGHVSTFNFGQLVIQVLAHRPGEIRIGNRLPVRAGPWQDSLLQIWPMASTGIIWPPALMSTTTLRTLVHRFSLRP